MATPKENEIKVRLCRKIERMIGYIPSGLNDILSILKHPDLIELTREWIDADYE